MVRRRQHERPQRGNPHQLTIDQHIHSQTCIRRFADSRGLVGVLDRSKRKPFKTGPGNPCFIAKRVWDQRLERGRLFHRVETAIAAELDAIATRDTVTSHDAISEYLSIWQIRANLAANPPDDAPLAIQPGHLTKDQEEVAESKGHAFLRGSVVPGRFMASINATRAHDLNMQGLSGIRWGVLRAGGECRFLCPDTPASELYLPISPTRALVAGYADVEVGDTTVNDLNDTAHVNAARLIFGHPDDIDVFHRRMSASR